MAGDLCLEFDKKGTQAALQSLNAQVQNLAQRASETLGLDIRKVADALDFDVSTLKLPGFFGQVLQAEVSSAVIKLSAENAFRGAHVAIKTGNWTHVLALEKATGPVKGRKGCPQSGEMHLTISSTSSGVYRLAEILAALNVKLDPGVGDASIFQDLEFSSMAAVLRGTVSDFGLVLSAKATYKELNMSVVLAVAGLGLGKAPTAAIKLHVLNDDALQLFLSYIGIPINAAVPEMQVGNIQVLINIHAPAGTL